MSDNGNGASPKDAMGGADDEFQTYPGVVVTTWNKLLDILLNPIYNWGRRNSLWPMAFGLACCAIEQICTAASRFDIARFGAELFRGTPRQADLMLVSGTVTKKMVPQIVRLYNQMAEPKYVIAMGACATGGGPFKEGYNVVSGIDKFIPVDVYVPGCPPTPQALLHGLMTLQKKIDSQRVQEVPWYRRGPAEEVPVPILGPDLIDPRQIPLIREEAAKQTHRSTEGQGQGPESEESTVSNQHMTVAPKGLQVKEETKADGLLDRLSETFPGAVSVDESGGYVVTPGKLVDVARYLKEQPDLAYDYLSMVTSVDYPDRFEVVYYLYSTERQGGPVVLKAHADREDPVVPSLVSVYAGADFQEREVYDMMGIRFAGHPNLKRILMWEGFEGWPLRKDYHEPYYEEDHKPFKSRWPGGYHQRAEERVRWGKNVQYPEGWQPDGFGDSFGDLPQIDVQELKLGQLKTDKVIVNIGPQHPSTHGVFRMVVTLDGETIVDLYPIMGYLHRNHEKIGERNLWLGNMPFTDRLDYFCSMANNLAYALGVEKLLGVEVPERAEYIRVIMVELTRILNHLSAIGFLLNDMGAFFTPVLYALEERELILDLFEMASGSRMMCNYMRFGGVAYDLPEEFLPICRELVYDRLPRAIDEMDRYLSGNEILMARCKGVGILPREAAINYSTAGPVLRASGVQYDVRRAEPYSIYDRFEFDIPTQRNGDVYDRYIQRIEEARQSVRILKQALEQLPEGSIQAGKKAWQMRVSAGEAYGRAENPKGELGFYLVSDGGANPYRYHVRAPSFINLTALGEMCKGHKVADVVVILGSIDIVMGEVDR